MKGSAVVRAVLVADKAGGVELDLRIVLPVVAANSDIAECRSKQ